MTPDILLSAITFLDGPFVPSPVHYSLSTPPLFYRTVLSLSIFIYFLTGFPSTLSLYLTQLKVLPPSVVQKKKEKYTVELLLVYQ